MVNYHGGFQTTYHAYSDEKDDAFFQKLHQIKSNEPTGVEIRLPIPNTIEGKEGVASVFYNTYFSNVSFEFNKEIIKYTSEMPSHISSAKRPLIYFHDGKKTHHISPDNLTSYFLSRNAGKTRMIACVNGIPYPIEENFINDDNKTITSKLFYSNDIYDNKYIVVFDFEINEIEIAATREGLVQKENNRKIINDRINQFVNSTKTITPLNDLPEQLSLNDIFKKNNYQSNNTFFIL